MAERNDISSLLGFIGREEIWRERLQDALAEHLVPVLEEFDLAHDDLTDLLGEQWSARGASEMSAICVTFRDAPMVSQSVHLNATSTLGCSFCACCAV